MDRIAYKSLISAPHFQELVDESARVSAGELYDTLKHLLPSSNHTNIATMAYGSMPTASEFFIPTFDRAMKLKAELLLSDGKYKLVFPCPGDTFCPETMVRGGNQHGRSQRGESKTGGEG